MLDFIFKRHTFTYLKSKSEMKVLDKIVDNSDEDLSKFNLILEDEKENRSIDIDGYVHRSGEYDPGDYVTAPCSTLEIELEILDVTVWDSEGDEITSHGVTFEKAKELAEDHIN